MIYLVVYLFIALIATNIMFGWVYEDEYGNAWNDFVEYILLGLVRELGVGVSANQMSKEEIDLYRITRQVMFSLAVLWPVLLIMFAISWFVLGVKRKKA
jgi:uncharacterized membrane protein YbjE (DUF340 family)